MFSFFILLPPAATGQKSARRQPACLLDAGREVRIDQVISDKGPRLPRPWVVYSNRGADLGKKYYVTDEDLTRFHVCSGSGTSGLTIRQASEVGWRSKQDFLFHFSAEFTPDALIHRKCVVLNSQGLVDSICKGLIEESRIPVYCSPTAREPDRVLPLYSIYFIYQAENKRYLLGKDYVFNPDSSFSSQIIGWVDAVRVFNYDNRLCFEPNFQSGAVQKRRCDTIYGNAKVFSTVSELGVFLSNRKVNIEPLWEEPNYFYMAPSLEKNIRNRAMDLKTLRHSISRDRCGQKSECFRSSFTNEQKSAEFFRFPFLGISKGDRKIFQVAATGKYVRSRQSICDSLSFNKRRVHVFFIIPDLFPATYSIFFLNQLHTKYAGFAKQYDGCFYPGEGNRLSLLCSNPSGHDMYNVLLDSLMSHRPASNTGDGVNCFLVLNQVLDRESFNSQETNLIVLINSGKTEYRANETQNRIPEKLAAKNCYLLAFDLADNSSFSSAVDNIMRRAIDLFRQDHGLDAAPVNWERKGNCMVMTNYLLAAAWSVDTAGLKGPQIMDYIRDSYEPVISTVTQVIAAECGNRTDTILLTPNETLFRQGLEKIVPGCGRNISSMRILQKGFTRMQYQNTGVSTDNIWQPEILMTDEELIDLTTAIDPLTKDETSTNTCNRICDLWVTLIRRFIGENIILDNSYLEYTIPQLLDKVIGTSWGYSYAGKIRDYNIRQICECQDEVNEAAVEYKNTLNEKNRELKAILHRKPFTIEREPGNSSNVKYYWIPVSVLP